MANPRIRRVDGRWEVVMDAGTRPDGSRKQIRRRFPTRRAAEDFRTKTLNEVRSGSYVEPSRELFGEYFARWILDRRGSLKPASVYVLKNVQTRLRVLDRVEIGEITPALVQRLVVTMQDAQYAATTVNKTFSVLKQCLRDAVAFRLIPDNPCDRVHTPKVPTLNPKSFTTAEVTRFREAVAGTERHALWETAIETGLRQGELAALRIVNVDFVNRTIHVLETQTRDENGKPMLGTPKSDAGMRTIAISASLAELLRAEVELMRVRQELRPGWNPEDLLFPNREGNREANEVANRWLKRACEAAGVPVLTMHGLRHTAGSQASAAGIAPNIIKERLGHSHIATTLQMYVHPDSGQHQDAADALEARFRRGAKPQLVVVPAADREDVG